MSYISNIENQIGVNEGKLAPCPKSPNCVSTQVHDKKHKIEPLRYNLTLNEAKLKIVEIVESLKRSRIIKETEDYIHAEFRTRTFKFVDDVEFFFDDTEKIIHFRSASRVGWSDMGVNRKRMENIRKLYLK